MRRAAYDLAVKLGQSNVDAMLESMNALQWREWQYYMALAPFHEERQDMRIASIVSAIVNMNRDPKKYPEPLHIGKFVLPFGDAPEVLPPGPTRNDSASTFGSKLRDIFFGRK